MLTIFCVGWKKWVRCTPPILYRANNRERNRQTDRRKGIHAMLTRRGKLLLFSKKWHVECGHSISLVPEVIQPVCITEHLCRDRCLVCGHSQNLIYKAMKGCLGIHGLQRINIQLYVLFNAN